LTHKDEAAFAALVRRHGGMVWGVCCRLLRSPQDAEDAFQATFLVLVQKAATLPDRERVGNWLYGVAHQTAVRMRANAVKRGIREKQVAILPEPTSADEYVWNDLKPILDEELSRLPDEQRLVLVLCDLEGRTRKEVAGQLAIPEGTVASRLAAARVLLAKRLARRGVVVSGPLLGTVLTSHATATSVPTTVFTTSLKAAALVAVGIGATAAVSPAVAELVSGVTKAMLVKKFKAATAVVLLSALALGGVGTGIKLFGGPDALARQKATPAAEAPMTPQKGGERKKDAGTAWGKEINGLQAGLGFRPGEQRAYHTGETVKLVVRVRNVGKESVKLHYPSHHFIENPPAVADDKGKAVVLDGIALPGKPRLLVVTVAPGTEIDLCELNLELHSASEIGEDRPWTLCGTGKFQLRYETLDGIIGSGEVSDLGKSDLPPGDKLATGKLELEVRPAPPPAAEKKDPQKQEKEGFTAWGKKVGRLQAGLGFRPGQQRAYHTGETVKLVLRVRNVGKEAVKFQHLWGFFHENPPTVTDAAGKLVPLPKGSADGRHLPRDTTVAPGKEVELYEWEIGLRPVGGRGDRPLTIHGVGKFALQCERVVGPTSANPEHPALALDKLATGNLELEVTDRVALVGEAVTPVGEEEPVLKRFVLKEVDGTDLAKVLSPLFKDAKIVADASTKSLLIEADAKTFERLTAVIELLERPADAKTPAPLAPGKTGPRQPGGILGDQLGKYLIIEGVLAEGGKIESGTILVDTVDGKKLNTPTPVLVRGPGYPTERLNLPAKQRCIFKGYESGEMIGIPPAVLAAAKEMGVPDQGIKDVSMSPKDYEWRPYFLALIVVEPKGLEIPKK
jgi:RNA polymerase sigma factor (sigma-70 family)